ncbi:transposase [Empedobacter tilapiae]|uniref:transposase n=1 Tax=Empedobacter tilapiae TaxID=2491114 RepID=UPI0028D1A8CB|nr:transposase [Empedobacter tilapiae]
MGNYKEIHVGTLINQAVTDEGVETPRICNFFQCSEEEIKQMYQSKSLDSEILLKWSKLLEYDFFRIYSQHLILYAPVSAKNKEHKTINQLSLPRFRKNIYTKEIIDFILEQLHSGEMTKNEIVERYRIPKTTLYKWLSKHKNS